MLPVSFYRLEVMDGLTHTAPVESLYPQAHED
jgi:hypothetical protein